LFGAESASYGGRFLMLRHWMNDEPHQRARIEVLYFLNHNKTGPRMNQEQLGVTGELSAKLDVLQIAIATLFNKLSHGEKQHVVQEFKAAIEQHESISRDPSDPLAAVERLKPHVSAFLALVR
jgi:hypothetical protein